MRLMVPELHDNSIMHDCIQCNAYQITDKHLTHVHVCLQKLD